MVEFIRHFLCFLFALVLIQSNCDAAFYITNEEVINGNYGRGSNAELHKINKREVIGYTVANSETFDIADNVRYGICRSLYFKHGNSGRRRHGDSGNEVRKVGSKYSGKSAKGGSKGKRQNRSSANSRISRLPRSIEYVFVRETLYRHVVDAKFAANRNRDSRRGYRGETEGTRKSNFDGFSHNVGERYGEYNPHRGYLFGNDRGYGVGNNNAGNTGSLYGHNYGIQRFGRYGEGHAYRNNNFLHRADEGDQIPVTDTASRDESNVHNLQNRPGGPDVNNKRSAYSHLRSAVNRGRLGGSRGGTSIFIL